MTNCTCPDQWFELVGAPFCANEDCPAYSRCEGQTMEGPPCGGCDDCQLAQAVYCDDGTLAQAFAAYHLWVTGQVANV